jgi:hypothetical protein
MKALFFMVTMISSSVALACNETSADLPSILLFVGTLLLPILVFVLLRKYFKNVKGRLAVLIAFFIFCISLYFSLPMLITSLSTKCDNIPKGEIDFN